MTQWLDWRRMFTRRKEKVEITVETRESWEVRWFRQSRAEQCPTCHAETIFIPPEIAAEIIQQDDDAIKKLLESGKVHFGETAENEGLICLSSLKRSMEEISTRRFLKDE